MSSQRVAQTVWPWRQVREQVVAASPRVRAVIEALVMTTVALILRLKFEKIWAPRIIFLLALFVLISGLCVPTLYRRFHRGLLWLGKMTGSGMTWLLLVPFFFICFPLGRVMFALKGKDPLNRRYDPTLKTYWVAHRPAASVERYKQQF